MYACPFHFMSFKYSPSNIKWLHRSYSFAFPFFLPFKYSPSNINSPSSLYSFTFPVFSPFKYFPLNNKIVDGYEKEYSEFDNNIIYEGYYLNDIKHGYGKEYKEKK